MGEKCGRLLRAVVKRRPKSERREWEEQVRIGEEEEASPRRTISGSNRALLRGREATGEAVFEVEGQRTAQMPSQRNGTSVRRREARQNGREAHM